MKSCGSVFQSLDSDIERCRADLVGATNHQVPYVTDETILHSLRVHNSVLICSQQNVDRHDKELKTTRDEMGLLRKSFIMAEENIVRQSEELGEVKSQLKDAQDRITALMEKTSILKDLECKVSEQNAQIATLRQLMISMDSRFTKHLEHNELHRSNVEIRLGSMEESTVHLEASMGRLKDELLLPAQNVILPEELQIIESGASDSQYSQLTHLLASFRDKLEIQEVALEHQRKILQSHATAIDGKASIELENAMRLHASRLANVQAKVDADAQCDLPSMLATLKEAETQLAKVLGQLKCKVSYEDVDVKIESRFNEILEYLQSTLHTTENDDDDIRRETNQLRCVINEVRIAKADRGDLAQLRCQMASQAVNPSAHDDFEHIRKELNDRPKRDEIFQLLSSKVSILDLKRSLAEETSLSDSMQSRGLTKQKHRHRFLHVPLLKQAHAFDPSGQCLSREATLRHARQKLPRPFKPLDMSAPVMSSPPGSRKRHSEKPLYISAISPCSHLPERPN
mmetsp:Transcript_6680/g.21027  ORF Transcript_6680/g.21027 Transcript_6680/m.21027 type:complete len:514 (+) Transcript_6680:41-1582(+)